jgi:hypothetical protein
MKNYLLHSIHIALFIGLILNTSCSGGKSDQSTEDATTTQATNTPAENVHTDSIPAPPPPQTDSFAKTREMLQGTWKSMEDPRSSIRFAGDLQIDLYDKRELDTLNYTLSHQNCDKKDKQAANANDVYILAKSTQNFEFCYLIQKLDNQSMTLLYKTRKSTLKFKKIK